MATSVNTYERRNDQPQRTDFKTKTERGWDEVCTSARAIFSANGHTFSKNRANENSPRAASLALFEDDWMLIRYCSFTVSVFATRHALLTCRKVSISEQNCKLLVWGEVVKRHGLNKKEINR